MNILTIIDIFACVLITIGSLMLLIGFLDPHDERYEGKKYIIFSARIIVTLITMSAIAKITQSYYVNPLWADVIIDLAFGCLIVWSVFFHFFIVRRNRREREFLALEYLNFPIKK